MDNDITAHLADALRDCRDHIRATQRITGGEFKADEAAAALAAYDAMRAAPNPHNLTARQWVERARETMDARTRDSDDAELIDAHDDLCNALEAMDAQQAAPVAAGDHTPEPWHAVHYTDEPVPCIIGPQGDERIAEMNGNEDPEANARRIVACVNACAGTPTERLESGDYGIVRIRWEG